MHAQTDPKPWPSTNGPSVFLSIPHFRTPEYSLFVRIDEAGQQVGNEPLEWHWFRAMCDVIGVDRLRRMWDDPFSKVEAG